MKYEINERHLEILNTLFDLTLKNVGINGVNSVTGLVATIGTAQLNPTAIIEISENQIKQINSMLDISLKHQGMQSLGLTLEITALLSNPLPDEDKENK